MFRAQANFQLLQQGSNTFGEEGEGQAVPFLEGRLQTLSSKADGIGHQQKDNGVGEQLASSRRSFLMPLRIKFNISYVLEISQLQEKRRN